MKTLAEQNMKPETPASVVAVVESEPESDSIKLLADTNGKSATQQVKIKRQQRISLVEKDTNGVSDKMPLLKSNGLSNGMAPCALQENHQLNNNINLKQSANENLTRSLVNKLNSNKQGEEVLVGSLKSARHVVAQETESKVESENVHTKAMEAKATTKEDQDKWQQQQEQQQQQQQQQEREPIGIVKKLTIDCLLYLIKGLIATYDLISQPICYFKHEVAKRRREVDHLRSIKVNPNDPNSPWRQVDIPPHQIELERYIDSFNTYDAMMKASYEVNWSHPCYGYRQIIEERMSKRLDNPDKLIKQVKLSDYKWCTYEQFERQIEAARRGLLRDGVRAGQRVILYADTRPEWQICSQALIRLGAIVGTMYSTLSVDGIVHTVNETQAQLIITQRDKVERLMKLRPKLSQLKKIIYMETSLWLPRELGGNDNDEAQFYKCCQLSLEASKITPKRPIDCTSLCELIKSGLELTPSASKETDAELEELERYNNGDGKLEERTQDSLAVIMYTSGSTGIPKGVLISHGNIMATIKSFSYVTKDFVHAPRDNICTAYLPLAHIFEFCIESVMLYHGVKFGFASPHTLTDKSPGLMAGQVGDLSKLQPTVMIIVPLILDRIVQGIKQALRSQSYFKEQLVTYLINYKSYWQKRHYDTPLVDKIVCSKMAAALGGRAKYVICGSAPLSSQTQTFVRAALNLSLPQGFGTTETCAATACQLFDDQSTQNVGLPVSGAQIKLEPWHEGNYTPEDKPNPRGEIVVGGKMIAHGYYNLEEQTKEAFYVDKSGTRWYRTGDIGEFLPNGQLKIIDRKKDLVKLQNGEYISLGRIESTLKSNPYTENFCVYANSNYNYVIALGPANELAIKNLAQQFIDEHEHRLSPSMAKRSGSPASMSSISFSDSQDTNSDERQTLLSDEERQAALDELREVLLSYKEDQLNNNNQELTSNRKASLVSQSGRERTGSIDSMLASPSACANERLKRLCDNKLILEHVMSHLRKTARERNLLTLEVPKKLLLLAEDWTEDKNLVTAAMKIRRNFIYKRYEAELEQVYSASSRV